MSELARPNLSFHRYCLLELNSIPFNVPVNINPPKQGPDYNINFSLSTSLVFVKINVKALTSLISPEIKFLFGTTIPILSPTCQKWLACFRRLQIALDNISFHPVSDEDCTYSGCEYASLLIWTTDHGCGWPTGDVHWSLHQSAPWMPVSLLRSHC